MLAHLGQAVSMTPGLPGLWQEMALSRFATVAAFQLTTKGHNVKPCRIIISGIHYLRIAKLAQCDRDCICGAQVCLGGLQP